MRVFGILGVVIVLCVGFFLYQRSIEDLPDESPQQTDRHHSRSGSGC